MYGSTINTQDIEREIEDLREAIQHGYSRYEYVGVAEDHLEALLDLKGQVPEEDWNLGAQLRTKAGLRDSIQAAFTVRFGRMDTWPNSVIDWDKAVEQFKEKCNKYVLLEVEYYG